MTKPKARKPVKAFNHYDAPYWQKCPERELVAHIIECGMQFVPNGRQVPIHIDGKLELGWTTTQDELDAFVKAAAKTALRVVKELRNRRVLISVERK